jgi:hypothetical protein
MLLGEWPGWRKFVMRKMRTLVALALCMVLAVPVLGLDGDRAEANWWNAAVNWVNVLVGLVTEKPTQPTARLPPEHSENGEIGGGAEPNG